MLRLMYGMPLDIINYVRVPRIEGPEMCVIIFSLKRRLKYLEDPCPAEEK